MNIQLCDHSFPRTSSDGRLLTQAATTAAEQRFYAFVEPFPHDDDVSLPGEWYLVSVGFTGIVAGAVCMAMPVGLGRELWAAFVGADIADDAPDASVHEAIGELVATTATRWLTGVGTSMAFDLQTPAVVRLSHAPDMTPELMINTQPVMLAVQIDP